MSDPQMDYSDKLTIVITRVSFMGEPSHWEYDVDVNEFVQAGGTTPSFAQAIDAACEYIWDERAEWVQFDANAKNREVGDE